jgi:hypothetical protein
MKYLYALPFALLALPAAASSSHCSVHETNGSWVYYSVAGGASPYTIACSLQIASGTITSGQCVSSDGLSHTATGSLTATATPPAAPSLHNARVRTMRPLNSVNHSACTLSGTVSYADIGLTETLSNLSVTRGKDEIVGVGTNGTGLLSVTFVNAK